MAGQADQNRTECHLDDPGSDHHDVVVDREPVGYLGPELLALNGEMSDARSDQRPTEQPTQQRARRRVGRCGGGCHHASVLGRG
jgi:hypothetical protein